MVRNPILFALCAVACARTGAPEILNDELAQAEVGTIYTQWLEASGGAAPLVWELTEGELPDGLVFNPGGAISGTAERGGSFEIEVMVTDAKGRVDWALLDLVVDYGAGSLRCGQTLTGTLEGAAVVDYDLDLDITDGYTYIQIPLPTDDTTRIDVMIEPPGGNSGLAFAFLGPPGSVVGEAEIDEYWQTWMFGSTTITIDLGTAFDLNAYKALGEPIVLLLATESPGDWSVQSTCTNGPIFSDLEPYPTLVGQSLSINYNVIEGNAGTRIWTDDPLPSWVEWEEDGGRLSGVAEETGVWEFTIYAEDTEHRTRQEQSALAVYEHVPLSCGDTLEIRTSEGYYEGYLSSYFDPRGYVVTETLLPPGVSAVRADLTGSVDKRVGFVEAGDYTFYAPSATGRDGATVGDQLSTRTWPSISDHLQAQDVLHTVSAANWDPARDLTLSIQCDMRPQLEGGALPVLLPDVERRIPIRAIGGSPPYSWSAEGLPAGVVLDEDGTLISANAAAGSAMIDLHIEDSEGLNSSVEYELSVGWDAACKGLVPLRCGDRVEGEFTKDYYFDGASEDSIRTFCMGQEAQDAARLIVTAEAGEDAMVLLAVARPGATGGDDTYAISSISRDVFPTSITLGESSDPPLERWADQPVLVSVLAYEVGPWSFEVDCE